MRFECGKRIATIDIKNICKSNNYNHSCTSRFGLVYIIHEVEMAIGDKLARGLANNTVLDVALKGAVIWKRLTAEFDNYPTPPTTAKGARKFLNHVQHHIDELSITNFRSEPGRSGPMITWFYFDIPDPKDLNEFCITKTSFAPLSTQGPVRDRIVFFSHHALARTHQRTGESDWKFVMGEFRAAIPYFQVIKRVMEIGVPLSQFFIPGEQGIFAGAVEPCGKLRLNTYIGESSMSKRWSEAFGLFERIKSAFPPKDVFGKTFADRLLTGDINFSKKMAELMAKELSSPEFCWVMDPYEPRDDPTGEKWLRALEQRDAVESQPRNSVK